MQKIKKRIFEVISVAKSNDVLSKIFDICIIFLVFLNVILLILDTYNLSEASKSLLINLEMFSVIVFTIEYLLRIWTAEFLYKDCNKFIAKLKYIFSFTGIIDLLAILPMYIPYSMPKGLIVIRTCRTLRILKLFKINRRFDAINIVSKVIKNKFAQLISSLYLIISLMITSSILMYNAEHIAQPTVFKNAFSGLWWTVSTIATIGYGDIYPVTVTGKILGIIITLLGISILAIPTAILTAGFIEEATQHTKESDIKYCPHCGKKIGD